MKSIFNLLKYTACTIVALCMVQAVSAQTQLSLTVTYTSGTFDNENGWELLANGTQVAAYTTGDTGPASVTACVLPGDALELYTYETFGDGWNGSTVEVTWGTLSLTGGPIASAASGNGACCAASGTGLLEWAGAAPAPNCMMTCPADQNVSTAPGTCVPGFSVITPPTVDANCLNVPADIVTTDGACAPLNMNATGLITTQFSITGVAPIPAAAAPCTPTVPLTVTMVADIGGAGFEQTDIFAEGPDGLIGTADDVLLGQNATSAGDCNTAGGVVTFNVLAVDYNAWAADGTINLEIATDPDIDNICATQEICGSVSVPQSCLPFTNDYNGTADASDVYPLGTTTVTFTSVDLITGGEVKCSFDVTVSDLEPPVLDCPGDFTFNLDPGACSQVYSYEVTATDNCPQTAYDIAGPFCDPCADPSGGSALACTGGPNSIIQAINVAMAEGDSLTGVCFNQETFGTTTSVTVNVYCDPGGGMIPFDDGAGTFTPLISETFTLNAGDNGSCVCLDFTMPVEIPTGCGTVFIEFFNTTGRSVQTPAACDGATADGTLSWIVAPACGLTTPGTFQGIGFALDASFLINVLPSALEAIPDPAAPAGYNAFMSGDDLPLGTHCWQYIATDGDGNTSTCDWCVTVEEFPEALQTTTLACNDDVNISVDENCSVTLTADMFLEGGPYGCYDTYILNVTPIPGAMTGNGTHAVTINASAIPGWNGMAGPFTVSVVDTANNNNSCWGEFMLEDKLPPVPTCEDATITCITDIAPGNTISGTVLGASADANGMAWADGDTGAGVASASAATSGAPSGAQITDVNVYLEIDHSWVSDLTVTLTGPNGATAQLVNGNCGANDNIAATFDDEAPVPISCAACAGSGAQETCETAAQPCATISMTVQAAGGPTALSVFDGAPPNGTWSISVDDGVGGDGGCVKAFNVSADWAIFRAPAPTIVENCAPVSTTYSDAVVFSDDCLDDIIERTWIATDAKGNTGSCVQTITIQNIGIADVQLPPAVVNLTCGDGTSPGEIAALLGVDAAYPTVAGAPIVNGSTCSLFYTYTDQEIPACAPGCDGNLKVIRTWTLIDWCNAGDPPTTYVQVIKAVDNDGPTLVELTGSTDLSVDPWSCTYSGPLPAPWLHDNCTEDITYTVSGPPGVSFFPFPGHPDYPLASGESYEIIGAPKGVHAITYTAEDCCGNTGTTTFNINVYDGTAPVAIGTQNIVLSLTSDGQLGGTAKIYTPSVDNGSYDGCTDVHIEIRRASDACGITGNTTYDNTGHPNDAFNDPDGGQFVKFCCSDIYDANGAAANTDTYPDGTSVDWNNVVVWMRVWDDGDMDGTYGSAGDNYNETWVNVRVENKFVPQINCVPDVVLTCDMDYEDLTMTGEATANGLCGELCTWYTDVADVNGCGVGSVFRFWWIDFNCNQIRDPEDFQYFCAAPQIITMTALTPFDGNINWPRDYTGEPGQLDPLTPAQGCDANTGEPTWNDNVCSLIASSVDIDTFQFEEGACYKVLKHWTVIDWCEFDANDPDLNTVTDPLDDGLIPGYWTHTQVIKYIDTEKPEFAACGDDMFDVDGSCQNSGVMLFRTATDDGGCSADSSTWMKWYITVDLWGDGTIDYEFTSYGSENTNIFSDGDGNGIPGRHVDPTASGEEVKVDLTGVSIEGSMFNHKVVWKVTDGCGNFRSCSSTFMVTDKKAPTPYCVNLSTALMENGMVELWACDFDLGAFDNCTASENLWFTFDDYGPDPNYINVPHYYNSSSVAIGFPPNVPGSYLSGDTRYWNGVNCAGRVFTECGEQDVQVYVWDEKGNVDYCDVSLLVGGEECAGVTAQSRIGGEVVTELGEGVQDIEMINISDVVLPNQMTDNSGHYTFENAFQAFDYTVTGEKMDDYMNGVSTLDLVLIQKHILILQDLDSPYKVIAADVNNDSNVSALDLVELRKLILGVYAELPNNASWRLVDATQTFADPVNPFPFNEERDIVNLQQDEMYEDFIAVKIGDVTNNAIANFQSANAEVRSSKSLQLEIAEQVVEAGQEVSIDVMSSNFADVFGYQFTMNLSEATFNRVESGVLNISASNVGVLNDNTLTMSWNDANGISTKADDVLFTIVLTATETANTSELISVNSNVTRAEAYLGTTTEIVNVELGVRTDEGTEIVSAFELFQNEPNPFDGNTQIGFNLPEAGTATLSIYDVAGKVVKVVRNEYERGYNVVTINESDLGTAGVLYYQLESGDFTATKKMIVIK